MSHDERHDEADAVAQPEGKNADLNRDQEETRRRQQAADDEAERNEARSTEVS
ncbi:MAG TPA: hypothetical protein VGF84_24980 [Micromonosporaceae bacterium]|jgi:hypothetical protein